MSDLKHVKHMYVKHMLKVKCDINQNNLKIVKMKSE